MSEKKADGVTNIKTKRTRGKPITYVHEVSDTPMSPEEWERVESLLAKIIAEAYFKDLRSKQSGE